MGNINGKILEQARQFSEAKDNFLKSDSTDKEIKATIDEVARIANSSNMRDKTALIEFLLAVCSFSPKKAIFLQYALKEGYESTYHDLIKLGLWKIYEPL